jgi:hypothetical protein
MKEMNFIEAYNYKKENPDTTVYRELPHGSSRKLFFQDGKLCFKYLFGEAVSNFLGVNDINGTWYAGPSKQPGRTHAEIMRNWFYLDHIWEKVSNYDPIKKDYYIYDSWHEREFFDECEMKTQEEIEK